ncbi:MAG: Phenylalanine-tRNA ligase beta subunit [candidate division TM6 bacterium GW2011_GWF2_37_49]|nr:MAG: Phenylalanine-tRNA ligase beta subunit [candidate division TM6 bacterium GW2011_GWF2_37_49]
MKLSLSWIFDHIDADWKRQDINLILSKFNTTTAEIEAFKKVKFDLKFFYLAKEISKNDTEVKLSVPELKINIALPLRIQAGNETSNSNKKSVFIIKKHGESFSWATLQDFDVEKDGLMPHLDASSAQLNGQWRQSFECDDIIIEIDNKSITHRPDMWGHRGFAREIAALLDLPFKDAKKFLAKRDILYFDQKTQPTSTCPITIENLEEKACPRFCGIYFKFIENTPSNLLITSRLLKVGSRPISGVIDLTNYLMQDWGMPVHAYDATKIEGQKIVVRMAKHGEKLFLLDGNEIELTTQDLVIADAQKPMCLAGVKGGVNSSVAENTSSVFLEIATFDAATIRRSAFSHKTRTDASSRFEKTLDPNQTSNAALRFLALLKQYNIKAEYAEEIVSVGHPVKEPMIEVDHTFLAKRIGIDLTKEDVINPLKKIGFKVELKKHVDRTPFYQVTVPTYRSSKDIKIKEDILEEVTRFYGFYRIPLTSPLAPKKPFDFSKTTNLRKIKNYLAGCAKMTEQQNYSFADEEFLAEIDIKIAPTPRILNPASQNNCRLINSLIPGLFKNMKQNHVHRDNLAFFEFAKIWMLQDKKIIEKKSLAGIFLEKKVVADFYQCKQQIIDLLRLLDIDIDSIKWQKIQNPENEWYAAYQSVNIILHDKKIGTMGNADQFFLSKLKIHEECSAVVFELDGDWLINPEIKLKRYVPFSKFQENYFDLSFMVPFSVKVVDVKDTIAAVSSMIKKVELIDFFEKSEWINERSLTFRACVEHFDRTLEKSELDDVMQLAITNVVALGAKLRS